MSASKSYTNSQDTDVSNTTGSEDVEGPEWFRTNAIRSGEVLRQIHTQDDVRRLDFVLHLQEFIDEEESEDLLHGLYEGRLPQVLMDIALDRSLYKEGAVDDEILEYLSGVHDALSMMIRHALQSTCDHPSHQAGRHHPSLRYVLRQYRHLWDVVADFPDLIKYDGYPPFDLEDDEDEDEDEDFGDDSNYRDGITHLLMNHALLSLQEDGHFPGLTSSQGGYVTLLCWTHCYDSACRDHLIVAQTGYFVPASQLATKAFLDKALARGTITAEKYIFRCCATLLDETLLNEPLWAFLQAMYCMYQHPHFKMARKNEKEDLRLFLAAAAQRQVCSGGEDEEHRVLRNAFSHIATIFTEDIAVIDGISVATNDSEFSRRMVLLVARALVPAAKYSDTNIMLTDIKWILRYFGVAAEQLEDSHYSGNDFRSDVRRIWHKTHDDLQKLSSSTAPQQRQAIELWRTFGDKCGVDIEAPYDPAAEPEKTKKQRSRVKSCVWNNCICFGASERPPHRLRRCKGCMKALYCSSKCQKRDWKEGGHRLVCWPPDL